VIAPDAVTDAVVVAAIKSSSGACSVMGDVRWRVAV
jgi:hypothetical protein